MLRNCQFGHDHVWYGSNVFQSESEQGSLEKRKNLCFYVSILALMFLPTTMYRYLTVVNDTD